MGCSSSLLMNPAEAWKPTCGTDDADDEMEWSASTASTTSLTDGLVPCGFPSSSNFNLAELHPPDPPFLGSAYWLPSDERYSFTRTPPPRLTVSPSEGSTFTDDATCSTSDNTLVMSNVHHSYDSTVGSITPRRLFDSPDHSPNGDKSPLFFRRSGTPVVIRQGVVVRGKVESPSNGSSSKRRRQRRIDTLPSTEEGRPIRLCVRESYSRGDENSANDCSYDPYFSSGQYHITTCNGSPYGNYLSVQMGPQNMTLQDGDGHVLAVMRSRHTTQPSYVIYGPKPRYPVQKASEAALDIPNNRDRWYPWSLVKKDGPDVKHDVSVHINTPQGWSTPVWKCRHGFIGDTQTHTVVTRVDSEIEEVPCCFVLRDPIHMDVFNLTIAPGIDPLLVICYLAVHSKMDVEPLMALAEC